MEGADLVEIFFVTELFAALHQVSFDDERRGVGESADFGEPLVFERRGADDDDRLNHPLAAQEFGGGDGLDGLAEAHLVGVDGASVGECESDAVGLVGMECGAKQSVEV